MQIPGYIYESPQVIFARLYDQLYRKTTGAPPPRLCRVLPQLYVGGQQYRRGLRRMTAQGITAVVNMREAQHDDAASGAAPPHYLHLPTVDNTPPTLDDLRHGVAFITQEIAQGGTVYIHCGVGVGRAPTMAAAYLVSTGMSIDDALAAIRRVRPFIWLNGKQRRQLETFAAALAQANPQQEQQVQ